MFATQFPMISPVSTINCPIETRQELRQATPQRAGGRRPWLLAAIPADDAALGCSSPPENNGDNVGVLLGSMGHR